MSKLVWDETGKRTYETGVDHGVLYVFEKNKYGNGVAWNGLSSVSESPSGAEASPVYADNIKYLNLMSAEEFGGSIECYTYPDEWMKCDGTAELSKGATIGQQKRSTFGLCYRTRYGNDTEGDSYGYKIHLVYGALASPSEKQYQTVNDSPEAITFSYEFTTTPVTVEGFEPTSIVVVDSTKTDKGKLAELEKILYGDEEQEPRLPLPDEVKSVLGTAE